MSLSDPYVESEYAALLEAEDYYRCEQKLAHFLKAAWPILEPGYTYLHNWHIDLIAEHLEAVKLGQIRKLIINQPPRSLKSVLVTVCFPAWLWIHLPQWRFLCASYAERLSTKHNVDRRTLIQSPWYQRAWADKFSIAKDQNEKTKFENNHRGQMFSTSVGGSGTGEGADVIIIDDPINPELALSETSRDTANRWRDSTISSRLNDKKKGVEILVMQRLHENDPTGHLLAKKDDPEPWVHVCLPAEAPKKTIIVFPVSKRELVREEGDILHPEREGPKELAQAKVNLGPAYEGQYEQNPKPMKGGFFPRAWWKRWTELPMNRIRRVQFWDCASKPGVSNDFSVCATWDEYPIGFFLIDLWVARVEFPGLKSGCQDQYYLHHPDEIVIEDKDAGVQLIQVMRADTSLPITAYNPGSKDKIVRAGAAQPTVKAGNAYLPTDRPWCELFISRHEKFPNDVHDDEVDTTSMMVEHFRKGSAGPGLIIL